MALLRIDTEDLHSKSQAVESSVGRLQNEVNQMENLLRQLQDTWQGQASNNFQAVLTEWRATQAKVEESLISIRGAMSQAAEQYSNTELANAAMFSR